MTNAYLNTKQELLGQLRRLKISRTQQIRSLGVISQNRNKARMYAELVAERTELDALTQMVKNREIRSERTLNKRLKQVQENVRTNRIQQSQFLEKLHDRSTTPHEAAVRGTFLRSINDEWRVSREWTTHSLNNAEYLLIKATREGTTIDEMYDKWLDEHQDAIAQIDEELAGAVFDDAEQEYYSLTAVYAFI